MTRSVSGLLILLLVFLISGCSGGAAVTDEPNESQKAVYDQLIELEGDVGVDAEGNIVTVSLNDEQVGNEDLDQLAQIPTLKELNLAGSSIDDDGLEKIAEFSSLTVLDIGDTKVSRRAVVDLKGALEQCNINSNFEFDEEEDD